MARGPKPATEEREGSKRLNALLSLWPFLRPYKALLFAAIGALVAQGDPNALTGAALTQAAGFTGTSGIFRLRNDGTNERGLAIAQIRDNQVVIVDPAPSSFGGAGL